MEELRKDCTQYYDVVSISAEGDKIVMELENHEEEITESKKKFMEEWEKEHGPWFSPYGY